MNKIDINNRSIGLNFTNHGSAQALVWAPDANEVEIVINDGKKLKLEKENFGYWALNTNEIQPGDNYKFRLNKKNELPDPASLYQPESVHGPSQAVDVNSYSWADGEWKNHKLKDYILYELHTGTFTPEGNFFGIEQKLDYLKNLGVNAIEILPVAQFPGNRNWGYDGVYPFAVQNSYGGPEGLQMLVDKCHQKGIAVVLDVVYNHLGPEGNYLGEYGPYFTDKYNTPWGKAINFDDSWCDGVRRYFIENVLMWFRDFHIDALRLDAVHAIKDFSPKHILKEIKEHVDILNQETGRNHHLIVEVDLNDTRFIDPIQKCGFGMDAQWIDEFHHALRVASGEQKTGYYSDFNGLEHLTKAYNHAYVYDGNYSPHRHKFFGTKTNNNPGEQFIVFSQNHDQVGNRMLGERTSQLLNFEMQKLLAGAVFISPFLPMLFMGEEWAASSPFQYFVSHTDPELVEAVRKGRKAEFEAFHQKGEAPDPQSEETFLHSKLNWDEVDKGSHKKMLAFYRKLINLRKTNIVLKETNRKNIKAEHIEEKEVIILSRWSDDANLICLLNFSSKLQEVKLNLDKISEMKKILDSADKEFLGNSDSPEIIRGNDELTVQPNSIIIYSSEQHV